MVHEKRNVAHHVRVELIGKIMEAVDSFWDTVICFIEYGSPHQDYKIEVCVRA